MNRLIFNEVCVRANQEYFTTIYTKKCRFFKTLSVTKLLNETIIPILKFKNQLCYFVLNDKCLFSSFTTTTTNLTR